MTIDLLERPAYVPALPRKPEPAAIEVRLAANAAEIEAYQRLRYSVFFEEMGAIPSPAARAIGIDFDVYDAYADHLLVVDPMEGVVGGYRLIRRSAAARVGAFYSANEFDIAPLLAWPGEILELGRSCVAPSHRTRNVMQLLWAGIAAYVRRHDVGIMFGCASLPGTDPADHAQALAYLRARHLAPAELRPTARPEVAARIPAVEEPRDPRRAFAALPPLLKGYLRLGGWIGDGAAVDREFNTLDVCLIVETKQVTERYLRHYLQD